ncbi:hypothetical protein ABPG72_015212 [Tetrahymena utriculariae]
MNSELQKTDSKPIFPSQDQSNLQNENTNSEDYQQIHNEDVMNAQQSQERAKTEAESVSNNPENYSQQSSQKDQDPQNSNQALLKPKEQDRNLNPLYFIGVNSIIMNVLFSRQLYFLDNFWIQILVLTLANTVTYIYLYKCKETKEIFKKIKQGSSSLKQKARSKINKKRVLIAFGVLLCISLIIITTIQIMRVQKLKESYNIAISNFNNEYYRINMLSNDFSHKIAQQYEYEQQKLQQYHIDVQRQEQINTQLINQLRQLEALAQKQSHEIEQLKLRLNDQQRQQILQNEQLNQQKQFQQTHQQSQQKNTHSQENNLNKGNTQERPDYPKIKHPIREQVRCS